MSNLNILRTPDFAPKPQPECVVPVLVDNNGAPLLVEGSQGIIIWPAQGYSYTTKPFNNARHALQGEGIPTRIEDLSLGEKTKLADAITTILKEGPDILTCQEQGLAPSNEHLDIWETTSYMLLRNPTEAEMQYLPDQRPSFTTIYATRQGALKITIASDLIDEIASSGSADGTCTYPGGLEISMYVNGKVILLQPGGSRETFSDDTGRRRDEIEAIVDEAQPGFSAFIDRMILVALKTGRIPGTFRCLLPSLPPSTGHLDELAQLARGAGEQATVSQRDVVSARNSTFDTLAHTDGLLKELEVFMSSGCDGSMSHATSAAITARNFEASLMQELTTVQLDRYISLVDAALSYMKAAYPSDTVQDLFPTKQEPLKNLDISMAYSQNTQSGVVKSDPELNITFHNFTFTKSDGTYITLTLQSSTDVDCLDSFFRGLHPSIEIGQPGSKPLVLTYDRNNPKEESNSRYLYLTRSIPSLMKLSDILKRSVY